MAVLLPTLPTLTVTTIYYVWCCYQRELYRMKRDERRRVRERVAFMLWKAAEQVRV